MTLFSRAERRTTLLSPASAWESDFGYASRTSASGVSVSEDSAVRLSTVYSCQTLISDAVSTLPLHVFREKGGKLQRAKPSRFEGWVAQPNTFHGPVVFWSQVMLSLLADGNAFIATIRSPSGWVKELYALDPTLVGIELKDPNDIMSERIYRYQGHTFNRSEILHIPGPYLKAGHIRALSPIDMAREAIGLGLAIEEYGARFFSQGTTMAGVIEHPGMPKPDEAKLLRDMFKKTHSGLKNSHAVGILTGGAGWKSITITPEQAQFLDTRRFQRQEIALIYRIPFHMIDPSVQSSWGSGVEEQNTWFITQTLTPWATRIEEALSIFILGPKARLKFNLDSRLRPKTKERYESYAVAVNNGWLSIDEIREMEDLPPLPSGHGSKHYRPLNNSDVIETPGVDSSKNPGGQISLAGSTDNDENDD